MVDFVTLPIPPTQGDKIASNIIDGKNYQIVQVADADGVVCNNGAVIYSSQAPLGISGKYTRLFSAAVEIGS